jgi:hypothetical protein
MPIICFIIALIVSLLLSATNIFAQQQQPAASDRAQTLAAALDKTKHKVKEKHNVRVEAFVEVKNEPVVKNNPKDYAGDYETQEDSGWTLNLRVADDGAVEASGVDREKGRFVLRDARIEGAVLSATKVYESGAAENFEGVFVNRTVRSGKNASDARISDVSFGFGISGVKIAVGGDFFTSNIFYKLKS